MINIERRIERVREVIKTNRGVRGVVIGAGALGSALIAACSQGPSQEQISQAVNQGVKQGIAEALKPTLTPTPTFDERVATAVDAALKKASEATAITRATVTPEARVAPTATVVRAEAASSVSVEQMANMFSFPKPTDFRPEAQGGMQNKLPKDWAKNTWNHLMFTWKGGTEVDTYATYWGDNSINMRMDGHGNPGQVIAQMVDEKKSGTLILAVGTLREFTDSQGVKKEVWKDKKTGSEAGLRTDLPTAIHLKGVTEENEVFVFDAETKKLIAKGTGNQYGDLTIDLSDEGSVVIVVPNLNDPTKTGGVREVNIVAGLDDYFGRADKDINRIDARQ